MRKNEKVWDIFIVVIRVRGDLNLDQEINSEDQNKLDSFEKYLGSCKICFKIC